MRYPIDLNLSEKLKDKEYRHNFFRVITQDEIAESIRELRLTRNLRQADLAERCSMKQSAISRIEQSSYSRWSFNTLWRLAEALDARIRLVIEPMENVIKQYEVAEDPARVGASIIDENNQRVIKQTWKPGEPLAREEVFPVFRAVQKGFSPSIGTKRDEQPIPLLGIGSSDTHREKPSVIGTKTQ